MNAYVAASANTIDPQTILDAVFELLREQELAKKITMTDIAKRSGVSRATMYRRWPNVKSLIDDLFDEQMAGVMASVVSQIDPLLTTRANFVKATVGAVREVREHPLKVILVDKSPDYLARYLFTEKSRSLDAFRQLFLEYLRTFPNDGTLRRELWENEYESVAQSVLVMATAFALIANNLVHDATELDRQLAELIDRFLAPAIIERR